MRQDHIVEGALPANYLDAEKNKKFNRKNQASSGENTTNSQIQSKGRNLKKKTIYPVGTVAKKAIPHIDVGRDHLQSVPSAIN